MYVCMYVYIYIYTHIHVYVYVYAHIYMYSTQNVSAKCMQNVKHGEDTFNCFHRMLRIMFMLLLLVLLYV